MSVFIQRETPGEIRSWTSLHAGQNESSVSFFPLPSPLFCVKSLTKSSFHLRLTLHVGLPTFPLSSSTCSLSEASEGVCSCCRGNKHDVKSRILINV